MWDALAGAVRTGTGHLHVDRAESAADFYGDTVAFISAMSDPFAVAVARRIGRLPGRRRVLEVGSGAAPWSRAIARLDPLVHVTALDLPPVLEVTRRHVVDDGLSTQYSYAPGNALTVELGPAAYDLVLVPNVCRLFDAATNVTLLARLALVVAPGGRLVVVDTLPGESPGLSRVVSLYALGLMIRTDLGGVHPEADYRRWFADVGLVDVTRWDVSPDHPLAVVLGRRP
jgi:ubiquinone/menaquinone biosynthesis C-methylase UbiE